MNPSSCEHIHLNIKTIRKSFEDFLIVSRASSLLGREFQLMAKAGPLHLLSLASLEVKFQRAVRNQRSREPKKECEKIQIAEIRNVKLKSTRMHKKHNSAKIQKHENKKAQNTKRENNKIQQRKNSIARSVENTETWKQQSSKGRKHETFTKTWNTEASKHKGTKTWKRGNAKKLNLESRRTRKLENAKTRKHENRETRNLEEREIATHEHTYRFKRRVHTLRFLFFFTKLRDGKIAFLTTTPRAVRTARCVVCKEGNIWMRSCVRAVRKSVAARFLLFVFLTFSFVNFLTCSLAHFSVSHFLISSLFTSSLAEFHTFSDSELSANRGKWVVGRLRNEANIKAHIKKVCHRDAALKFNIIILEHWHMTSAPK